MTRHEPRGFSLLEVLIATAILTTAVGALAQLLVVATMANRGARMTTLAAVFASEKMEELSGLAWGDPALGASPAGTLGENTSGYCDFLDSSGQLLAGGSSPGDPTAPPAGAVFTRRWAIAPLPADPGNTAVLQVLVTARRSRGRADLTADVARLPDEARLISVKTRRST